MTLKEKITLPFAKIYLIFKVLTCEKHLSLEIAWQLNGWEWILPRFKQMWEGLKRNEGDKHWQQLMYDSKCYKIADSIVKLRFGEKEVKKFHIVEHLSKSPFDKGFWPKNDKEFDDYWVLGFENWSYCKGYKMPANWMPNSE